jgi:hypothetical protein
MNESIHSRKQKEAAAMRTIFPPANPSNTRHATICVYVCIYWVLEPEASAPLKFCGAAQRHPVM